ncbi:aminotransferase [Bacillaceae bacterium JMAK1]|nr:aminotransferase [Bacillaceae bacterium JMAK1]
MTQLQALSKEELQSRFEELTKQYERYQSENLNLNMSRGKPAPEQLDLSMEMLDLFDQHSTLHAENGIDLRNYGGLDGIPEAKQFFAQMLEVDSKEVIIGGNSSLTLMHDTISRAMFHGVADGKRPWKDEAKVKFLAPSPGYDRHFAICEHFGIELIVVEMLEDGPNMEEVEALVREDESIKGIWCVPKYSNPSGAIYSDEVVERLAKMETKADDFRIFWDDAYTVHHLTDEKVEVKNVLETAKAYDNSNRPYIFASTSKVTFPGSGVAAFAASEENVADAKKHMSVQTIGYDKINQLRHVHFFTDVISLEEHMKKHAAIIKPKFDLVYNTFREQLGNKGIASWSEPKGGYFISLDTPAGTATDIVQMAKEAGVTLTGAGATFPYGKDPEDKNIRIAPTFPTLDELEKALDVLCTCIELKSIEKLQS